MATMKNKKGLIIAIALITVITISVLIIYKGSDNMDNPNGGYPISAPEGSLIFGDIIIPPEDVENFNRMGEMFLAVLPFENIDPLILEEPDYPERFALSAAGTMYLVGIRELRELTIIEMFDNGTDIKAEDSTGAIYYIGTIEGYIDFIVKDSFNGEVLFDRNPWNFIRP